MSLTAFTFACLSHYEQFIQDAANCNQRVTKKKASVMYNISLSYNNIQTIDHSFACMYYIEIDW